MSVPHAVSKKYWCDVLQSHRNSAELRDKYRCGRYAEFLVWAGPQGDRVRLTTCAQHMSKAVRAVGAAASMQTVNVYRFPKDGDTGNK